MLPGYQYIEIKEVQQSAVSSKINGRPLRKNLKTKGLIQYVKFSTSPSLTPTSDVNTL